MFYMDRLWIEARKWLPSSAVLEYVRLCSFVRGPAQLCSRPRDPEARRCTASTKNTIYGVSDVFLVLYGPWCIACFR